MQRKRTSNRAGVDGPGLLAAFLSANRISLASASRALAVSHVSVGDWIADYKRPSRVNAKKLDAWTAGVVPESSWFSAEEERPAIEPYSSSRDTAA